MIKTYLTIKKMYSRVVDSILNLNPRLQVLTDEAKITFMQLHTTYDSGFDFSPTITYGKYLIHDFKVSYQEGKLKLVIELERPGILIGRAGSNLDMLEEKLGYKISIVESKLWRPRYYYDKISFFEFNKEKIEWIILLLISSYFPLRFLFYLIFNK